MIQGSSFAPAPIANALVIVYDALGTDAERTHGFTDSNGQVDFKLTQGTYVVSVQDQGRVTRYSEPFTLWANQSHSLTFVLNPTQ